MRPAAIALPLLSMLLVSTSGAGAQSSSSSLSGTVTDASGAVITNAKVTVKNEATNEEHTITTNGAGAYTFPNLAIGLYTVTVTANGFESTVQQGTHLDPNIGSRYDASLKTGNASTSVTVQANANTLQTESSSVGQLVTSDQVKSIQLNGRNPIYLSQLEPGVARNSPMSSFNFAPDFSGPVINGARSNESLITLDGSPMVRTRGNGTQIGVSDVDTISQVQILTTSYPAEFGETSGGLVQLVPKSGTSTYHGSAYDYLRNSFFDANTWLRNQSTDPTIADHPAPFRFNQFGWNLNGPVYIPGHFNKLKTKLFFLAGEEFLRYRQNATQQGRVPTALMRTGDFSELLAPGNIFYGAPVQLKNPVTGQPYAGNVIPAAQLSPNGIGLLNAFPTPTGLSGTNNWIASAPYPQNQRKDTLVIDYVPAEAHHIRFSVLSQHYDQLVPFAGNFNRTPQAWDWPNQVGVLHYTWTISPSMVNDATFSVSADHVTITTDTSSGLYNRTNYGINFPYVFPAADKLIQDKIPTINIQNFTILDGGPYPSHSGGVITNLADNLTKVIGTHTLTFGGLWERTGENNFDQIDVSSTTPGATNNQNGQFVFTDTRANLASSGAAVGNAALGLFDSYGEIGQKSYTLFRNNFFAGFAQDQWRANSKTVIEYGLRYSVMEPFYALWRNQSVFDPTFYNPSNAVTVNPTTDTITGGDPYNGVTIPGSGFPSSAQGHVPANILSTYGNLFHNTPRGYSNTIFTDFQPRLGFTYQVQPGTVIRAGGGRFVQRIGISDSVQLGGNAPFQPTTSITGGSVDDPGGTAAGQYPLALSSQAKNFPNPNAWSWNVAVEQEIPSFGTFTAAYVGRKGIHLTQLDNVNQLQPGSLQSGAAIGQADALRPYKGFASILQDTNAGSSMYNGLQLNLRRRLSKGVSFGVAYTFSKSMDYGSNQGYVLPNVYNERINYGPSDFDIRHILVVNYVWNIPYAGQGGNRLMKGALGNWQVSGTTQAQTGEPFSVGTGNDYAGVGQGSGTQLWNLTRQPVLNKQFTGAAGGGNYFDPSTFAAPAPGTFAGAESRNQIYNPGFQSWNIALVKAFSVIPNHENHQVTFRAEAFNFTNHPNWDGPDSNPTDGNFGQVTQKGNSYASDRQLQFSLRYQF
ncbi:hypothetical protein D1Y84_12930 [Acidipila sp. EB88]|nr:hypothetical protein D1Y84_12930 [Acidipila sp. EB88]